MNWELKRQKKQEVQIKLRFITWEVLHVAFDSWTRILEYLECISSSFQGGDKLPGHHEAHHWVLG